MSIENKVGIYALTDPISNKVRYIGKSTSINIRYKAHICEARSGRRQYPVYKWIRKLLNKNLIPNLVIIEIDPIDIDAAEMVWIAHCKKKEGKLLNVSIGGAAIYCSPEKRKKSGASGTAVRLKNHTQNPEQARLWKIKHQIANTLLFFKRRGLRYNEYKTRLKMKQLAACYPNICGEWVNL